MCRGRKVSLTMGNQDYSRLTFFKSTSMSRFSIVLVLGYRVCVPFPCLVSVALGLSFVNLAFSSSHSDTRRAAFAALQSGIQVRPKVYTRLIRESLKAWCLAREASANKAAGSTNTTAGDEDKNFATGPRQVLQLLATAIAFGNDVEEEVKQDGLTELVVLAHHAELGKSLLSLVPLFSLLSSRLGRIVS